MSKLGRLVRESAGAAAIVLAAGMAALATVVCSTILGIRWGWPPNLISRADFRAPRDGTWSASWEIYSHPAADFPREVLATLVRTTAHLAAAMLIAVALSLTLHAVNRILAQWRALVIRSALGAGLRQLLAHAGGGLCALGIAGCVAGSIVGGAIALGLQASWPTILVRSTHTGATAVAGLTVTTGVTLLLGVVALGLLFLLQRGVRVISDLHGDHVTMRGPLLFVQSTLAVIQLAGLLVVAYASMLVLGSGVPAVPQPALHPYPDSLAVLPMRWTGRAAASPRARAGAWASLLRAADAAGLHVALASPDAWPGLGKPLELLSICGDCHIGQNFVAMLAANVRMIAVFPGTVTRMIAPIARGRELAPSDSLGAQPVAVLNGVAAKKLFTGGNPLHKLMMASLRVEDRYEVIGVARSITPRGLGAGGGEAIVYVSILQSPPLAAEITAPAGEVGAVRRLALRAARRDLRPAFGAPFALRDRLRDYETPLDWFAAIMTALAVATALVSAIALAALMTELVVLREREIAVRMALGARPLQIVNWVVGRSVRIATAGATIGVLVARWMGYVVRAQVMGNETDDLFVLAVLAAAFGVLGILASLRAAPRAVRIEPAAAWAEPKS